MTAIFLLCSPQFRNCLNFLKRQTGSLSVRLSSSRTQYAGEAATCRAASLADDYGKRGGKQTDMAEVFRVFILFYNKHVHFSMFFSVVPGHVLTFPFLPLLAALDCAIFLFLFFSDHQNDHLLTSMDEIVGEVLFKI